MRSIKLQSLALLILISCQAFAFDYRNLQADGCKCTCECQSNNNNNGVSSDNNNSGNGNNNSGGSDNNNTGGSGKQPRDFAAWFANQTPDAWGNKGLSVILKNINGVITKAQSDKWLADITNAAKSFPDFCNSGNEQKDKQEFAAFLTIIGAETSFNPANGFPCTKETGCPNCDACSYNSKGKQCSTNNSLQYFGRGPLQLSWDFNYVNFSNYYFKDDRALTNPDIITQNEQTCWASAIWFWMTPQNYGGWCMPQAAWPSRDTCTQSCPNGPVGCSNTACTSQHWLNTGKASPHDAIQNGKGIGQVINIINGGYDCCPTTNYFTSYGHTLHRVEWFAEILQAWGENLPYSNLSTVPIEECPAAQGTIDCSRLASTCYWNCCSAKSK